MPHRENLRTLIPLEGQSGRPTRQSVMTGVNGLLEKILAVDRVRSLYDTLPACSDPFQFLECTLERLQIDHRLDEKERRSIPSSGPAIVVANHAFSGIDGMVLASALSSVPRDIKILVNFFLENIRELKPLFSSVDPFNQIGSTSRNI